MRAVSRKDFPRLGGAGLIGASLLGAAGCNRSHGKVVRFLTGTKETAALERAVTEIQVDRFEEQHPNIDLQREALQPDEVRREIQSRLRSKEPPDVFAYDTGPGFGGVLADAGLLHPLEKAYKEHGWDIYDWAKQQATYDGTVYGVPDQVEEIIVFYNKDLVPEVPHTVEELRQISGELEGQGSIPLAFGNRERYPASHMFSIGTSNVLGREGLDDILYGDGRWDTPQVVEAIERLCLTDIGSKLFIRRMYLTLLVCCICYYTRGGEFPLTSLMRKVIVNGDGKENFPAVIVRTTW
jgi:raffinose/stachyose/melibiose transport system substrate-binding protein